MKRTVGYVNRREPMRPVVDRAVAQLIDTVAFNLIGALDSVSTARGGNMKYHLISTLLIVAALMLETVGFAGGGIALLGAGVGCEIWFWVRVAHRRQPSRAARQV
jgi:hypothetical protein